MEEIIAAVGTRSTPRTIKKHQILLYQGEIPRHAYIMCKGIIKAYSINASGNEQINAFYTAQDVFPLTWIFDKTSNTMYYYEAVTDCEVLIVDKTIMQEVIYAKPKLLKAALDYMITAYTSTLIRITGLEQSRASEKIMFTLYYLAFRYGREVKPGVLNIELDLTQSMVADMVGLTRETAAIELGKLKKQGVINYVSKRYLVHKAKLERLMGEDSFSNAGL